MEFVLAGYRLIVVEKISLPAQFIYNENESDIHQCDFAILTLTSQLSQSKFIPLVSTIVARPRSFNVIYYAGFKLRSKNHLITFASCHTQRADLKVNGDIFHSSCDVPAGMTGAAIIVNNASGQSILGIMSASRYAGRSIGIQFSPSKLALVCEWLGEQGRIDGVCG